MEKSRFVRYDPSVHEVMQHLMYELRQRSNGGQLVPTSLRRSELQYDLFIPRYEILRPSSVSNSMADHLKILGFVGRIVTQMFVRDKKKTDDDFVPARYLNEYSSVAETKLRKLQLEVGSASMPRSENKRKRVTPRKRCLKDC